MTPSAWRAFGTVTTTPGNATGVGDVVGAVVVSCTTSATAPRAAASAANLRPSAAVPGTATKRSPGPTRRESSRTSAIGRSANAASALRVPSTPRSKPPRVKGAAIASVGLAPEGHAADHAARGRPGRGALPQRHAGRLSLGIVERQLDASLVRRVDRLAQAHAGEVGDV